MSVMEIIAPILFTAATGFALAKFGVLEASVFDGLRRFLMLVAIPLLLLMNIAEMTSISPGQARFGLLYGVLCFVVAGMTLGGTWMVAGSSRIRLATMWLAGSVPNTIIIGMPVTVQALGSEALPYFVVALMVENLVMLPVSLVFLEIAGGSKSHWAMLLLKGLGRAIRSPLIASVVVGAVIALVGFKLPSMAVDTMELLSAGVTGIALFFAGGLLSGRSEERRGDSRLVVVAVATRLCLAPALAYGLVLFVGGLGTTAAFTLILFAAAPCFSIFPILVAPYGTSSLAARIQAYGTFFAIFTMSFWIGLLL